MNAYNYWHAVVNYLCVEHIIGVGIIIDFAFQNRVIRCKRRLQKRPPHKVTFKKDYLFPAEQRTVKTKEL